MSLTFYKYDPLRSKRKKQKKKQQTNKLQPNMLLPYEAKFE